MFFLPRFVTFLQYIEKQIDTDCKQRLNIFCARPQYEKQAFLAYFVAYTKKNDYLCRSLIHRYILYIRCKGLNMTQNDETRRQ